MTLTAHRQKSEFHVRLGPRDLGGQLLFLPLLTETSQFILTESSEQILVEESTAVLNTVTAHKDLSPFHALGGIVSSRVLHDTFTDADGTRLDAHAMDVGGGWTVQLGDGSSIIISSNQAAFNLNTPIGNSLVTANAAADGIFTGIAILGGTNMDVVFRSDVVGGDPNNNKWDLNFGITANALRLLKVENSTLTIEASTSITYDVGDIIDFRITLSGSTITCADLTNNVDVSLVSTFNQRITYIGMGENQGNNAARFDNFQMNPLHGSVFTAHRNLSRFHTVGVST